MKISVVDRHGSGILSQFAQAIGATLEGRFLYIPINKGSGYITGFSWKNQLRMAIRNFHLKEEISLQWTNEFAEGQDEVIFVISGAFPHPLEKEKKLLPEPSSVLIATRTVSHVLKMPPDTYFRSITLVVSRQFLRKRFHHVSHPVVKSILEEKENFAFEAEISPEIIKIAGEMLTPAIPAILERQFYKLKSTELLYYIFSLLLLRETSPTSTIHIDDIKAIYAVKAHLLQHLTEPPDIAAQAIAARMSAPKLRKLFTQTFGKGIFEYYQSMRMQEAARLLKEKHLTVSEVGYQLGFTNLSHFSRVFEAHIGVKPKKYATRS